MRKIKNVSAPASGQQAPASERSGARKVRALLPLIVFLALVTTLAAEGFLQAARMFTGEAGEQTETNSGPFAVGQTIPTSFGAVAIEGVENLTGLTSQDLGGVTHGVQNLVLADQAQIQVSILLTNQLDSAVYYSPSQFRLLAQQSPDPLLPFGSTVRPGMLGPHASLVATLSFVAPRNGDKLRIRFDDPAGGAPIFVDAGRVDQAPAAVLDDIHH